MPDKKFIHAGWLIDGSGEPVHKNVLLTIVNGFFSGIESFDNNAAPDHDLVTDLSHCTILPPLVDSYVHLALSSTVDELTRKKQLVAPYSEIHDLIGKNLHYHFTHGVLAVSDTGDRSGHVMRYRNEQTDPNREHVLLKTAGSPVHKQGRYDNICGRRTGENESLTDVVARETDSFDFIKIINSAPHSLDEFGQETLPQFGQQELHEMVKFAEQKGKKVIAHANGKVPVRNALDAGCDAIEQGYGMGDDNLRKMAQDNVLWIPNILWAKNGLDSSSGGEGVGCRFSTRYVAPGKPVPGAKVFWNKRLSEQLAQLSLARKLGVTTATGTGGGSAGILHGESMVEEIKLFIKAGYSLSEALRCATFNGAKLLGIENEMGLIAKGKPANFLVARGTPAQLPRKLSYLEGIYLNGMPCSKGFFEKV